MNVCSEREEGHMYLLFNLPQRVVDAQHGNVVVGLQTRLHVERLVLDVVDELACIKVLQLRAQHLWERKRTRMNGREKKRVKIEKTKTKTKKKTPRAEIPLVKVLQLRALDQ